jgi:hypothetical protein
MKFIRKKKQQQQEFFTARITCDERSLKINGCRKKSGKLIRLYGSRCSKPSSKFRHSGDIRESFGI